MKNKPARHKETNTFKFQTFSERIGNINIDVFHRVGHKYEEEDSEDQGTFFHQCLQKWSVLNLTESFDNFRRGLPSAQTLPQLLNQKDEVFAALMKHIEMKNPLSLQPLLELVVAFARDLYHDFYPYYQRVLTLLISLLSAKDADVLEWVFTALAYVFKFLWRCLVRNVNVVFDSLLPLSAPICQQLCRRELCVCRQEGKTTFSPPECDLNHNPPVIGSCLYRERDALDHVVTEASKGCYSIIHLCMTTFCLRGGLEFMPRCRVLGVSQSLSGCGSLLFEGLRGVSGQFHSSAELVLTLYLQSLGDPNMPTQTLYEVLTHVVDSMLGGIKRNKGGLFWKCALDTVSLFTQGCHEKDQCELAQKALILTLHLLWYQLIALLRLSHSTLPDGILVVVIEIGALLLQSEHVKLSQEHSSLLTREILSVPSPSLLVQFVERVFHYSGFESLVLPHVLRHCRDSLATEDGLRKGLCLLTKLVLVKAPLCSSGMELESWERYNLDFDR
ncbi:unnamed protein product [Timema podura]|uniref:Uncharacterized protein n=1 Tax=Timema podura TaxID=61482 RepID=A0ABN7P534_TIMPD|nr:unnamed protein product [Timema podura]